MRLRDTAESVGRGFFAGVVGTAAITASMKLEARWRNRTLPPIQAEAVRRVAGVEALGEKEKERLARLVHWQYGTAWGGVRGVLASLGLSPSIATLVHFLLVWGAAGAMLPALGLAPPPTKQAPSEVTVGAIHHLVYAWATAVAYEYLSAQGD